MKDGSRAAMLAEPKEDKIGRILRKFTCFEGYTRLEAVLTSLLVVSIGFVVWAVLPVYNAVKATSEPMQKNSAGESRNPEDDEGLLWSEETQVLLDPEEDSIPVLAGKTNMPAPVRSSAKKRSAANKTKPLKTQVVKKAAPKSSGKPSAPGKTPAPVKRTGKAVAAKRRPHKIPGIRSQVIDAPPEVMEILMTLEGEEWSREVEIKLLGAVRRWAREDISAASGFVLEIERRGTRNAALNNVLNTWLATSPQGAQEWFVSAAQEAPSLLGDLTSQFYNRLAVKAPVAAMAGLWDLPNDAMKRRALSSVSQRLIVLGRQQDVLDLYDAVESDADKRVVIDVTMQKMARYEPDKLGQWVFDLPDDHLRQRALDSFVSAWSHDYPSGAAEWVENEVPADADRARQIATVTGAWLKEDPVETAEWLLSLFPASSETDPAVAKFARAVLPQDPAYAAAWSFSVTAQSERWKLMEQVAANWMRKAPEAAREYVEQTDLPKSVKSKLLK